MIEGTLWDSLRLVVVFAFGAICGSYGITIISRLKKKEKIKGIPSHCMACGQGLRFRDICPILSYLLKRGRCSHCGSSIGINTLLWELGGGLVILLVYLGLSSLVGYNEAFSVISVAVLIAWLLERIFLRIR